MRAQVPNCCQVHKPEWGEYPAHCQGMPHQLQVWSAVEWSVKCSMGSKIWHWVLGIGYGQWNTAWAVKYGIRHLFVYVTFPQGGSSYAQALPAQTQSGSSVRCRSTITHVASYIGRLVESGLVDLWMKEMGEKAKQENKKRIRQGETFSLILPKSKLNWIELKAGEHEEKSRGRNILINSSSI